MQWSVWKNFHGCGTSPTYDVISTRSLSTISKGLSSETHAHLIAAAPDLIGALKVAESELRYHAATRNSEALEIVRAAIRKAEGVAP
jgi:hypothetical protein